MHDVDLTLSCNFGAASDLISMEKNCAQHPRPPQRCILVWSPFPVFLTYMILVTPCRAAKVAVCFVFLCHVFCF